MDVGFYLGELLMQQGEVSVPGLGYFVLARIGAYYDESESKFYPPYHRAQFDIQSIDDDALAEYIAAKKNISVASAKYFCQKYINNLKQEALISEVAVGNLGKFYTDLNSLTFKPAEKIIEDPIFFGFEAIKINRADERQTIAEHPKIQFTVPQAPVAPADAEEKPGQPLQLSNYQPLPVPAPEPIPVAVYAPPIVNEQPVEQEIAPEFVETDEFESEEQEEEKRGPLRLILIILAVLIVIGAGMFALYRYQPDTFAKMAFWQHNEAEPGKPKTKMLIADPVKLDTPKMDTNGTVRLKDSVAKPPLPTQALKPAAQPVKDQGTNNPAATVNTDDAKITTKFADATGTRRFEVLVAPPYNDINVANAAIKKLRSHGLDAKIIPDMPGPLKHISIANFKTLYEASTYAEKISQSGKVTNDVYPQEIIPQK